MRTQEEIADRFRESIHEAFFYELGGGKKLFPCLGFAHGKEFCREGVTESDYADYEPPTDESILADLLDYMPFAWDKANNCRGISAGRSVENCAQWIWLLGDDELFSFVANGDNYEHYGKEILIAICEKYGWDWKQWDNGVRTNREVVK